MKITITGASDDLIEIEGDIEEEFNPSMEEIESKTGMVLAISDGTLLRVRYDEDGIWRFTRLVAGLAKFSKEEGSVIEDTFDIVTLEGNIFWAVLGIDFATTK